MAAGAAEATCVLAAGMPGAGAGPVGLVAGVGLLAVAEAGTECRRPWLATGAECAAVSEFWRATTGALGCGRARGAVLAIAEEGDAEGCADVREALASDDVLKKMATDGTVAMPGTPEDYAARIDREEAKWSRLIKQSGVKVN